MWNDLLICCVTTGFNINIKTYLSAMGKWVKVEGKSETF